MRKFSGVRSNLKPGGFWCLIEHVGYAGPPLWRLLFHLYQQFFENFSVSKFLKTGIICYCLRVKVPKPIKIKKLIGNNAFSHSV